MSSDQQQPLPVRVIGAGCAGLSLAARAADLPGHKLSLIAPKKDDSHDHIWGFLGDGLVATSDISHAQTMGQLADYQQ